MSLGAPHLMWAQEGQPMGKQHLWAHQGYRSNQDYVKLINQLEIKITVKQSQDQLL